MKTMATSADVGTMPGGVMSMGQQCKLMARDLVVVICAPILLV